MRISTERTQAIQRSTYRLQTSATQASTTTFPNRVSANDNVLAYGQTVTPPKGRYFSIHMLAAAESAIATGSVNATYSDGSVTSGPVLVDPYWDWP